MKLNLELIQDSKTLKEAITALLKEDQIAFDTEFIREKTFLPELALIQIASEKEAWLIDPLSFDKNELAPFFELITSPKITKIMHAAFGDQECLYTHYQITASPSFDTAEAAALLGYGANISLKELLKIYQQIKLPKFLTRTHWLKRPLSLEMRKYALSDVQYLVALAKWLQSELRDKNRETWAYELSAHYEKVDTLQNSPEEIAHRLAKSGRLTARAYSLLKDLVKWRESRALEVNIPRKRIADDNTLINLANAMPESIESLKKFRGIHLKEIEKQGEILLKLVKKSQKLDKNELPTLPKVTKINAQESRIVDFLNTFLKSLATKYKVSSRVLLNSKQLKKIIESKTHDPKKWVEMGICNSHVGELIGKELNEALMGQSGLIIKEGKLCVFSSKN